MKLILFLFLLFLITVSYGKPQPNITKIISDLKEKAELRKALLDLFTLAPTVLPGSKPNPVEPNENDIQNILARFFWKRGNIVVEGPKPPLPPFPFPPERPSKPLGPPLAPPKLPISKMEYTDIYTLCPKDAFFGDLNPFSRAAVMLATQILLRENRTADLLIRAKMMRDDPKLNSKVFYSALSSARYSRPDLLKLLTPEDSNELLPFNTFPDKFINNEAIQEALNNPNSDKCVKTDESVGKDNGLENILWYFREDIFLNSHHWFWHRAYPTFDPNMADRRAEMFYYMHSAIIARYKTERMTNGLPSLIPLQLDPNGTVAEGYNPHLNNHNSGKPWGTSNPPCSFIRMLDLKIKLNFPGGTSICDVFEEICVKVDELKSYGKKITQAIKQGSFKDINGIEIGLKGKNGLGYLSDIIEASTASKNPNIYGHFGLHGGGHVLLQYIMDPNPTLQTPFGVIGDTATTMRDPLFYRWHGLIDDYFEEYKQTLEPYLPTTGENKLEWNGVNVDSVKVMTIGNNNNTTPNTLNTFWNSVQFETNLTGINLNVAMSVPKKTKICAKHLDHKPFSYRIEITRDINQVQELMGTVRIFMAPRLNETGQRLSLEEERRLIFPLDRFTVKLNAGKNVIERWSNESTLTIPWTKQLEQVNNRKNLNPNQEATKGIGYCGCGWPHHLLLPKGTAKGKIFDLIVMVTNGQEDSVEKLDTASSSTEETCKTAEIYCGIPGKKYPDSKPMGYPFDRKAFSKTLEDMEEFVSSVSNMAISQVVIVHDDGEKRIS